MGILLDQGVDALTMRGLADSLDLTAGALYRYFPSKGAILTSLGHRAISRISETTHEEELRARESQGSDQSEVDSLHLVIARAWAYWQLCKNEPGTWRLINLLLADPRKLIPEGDEHADFMATVFSQITRMAALLDDATGLGALDSKQPGVARAIAVLSALNGSMLLIKLSEASPVAFDPSQTLQLMLGSLLKGWGANPAALKMAWARFDHT
jgi:AcrR family transcriptional regulator